MTNATAVYLSLGSNLGDRAANLDRAIAALSNASVRLIRRSSLYETEPVDFLDQPWFLNCAIEAETLLSPRQLIQALQGIEALLGSKKLVPRGPRIIDLDVLFYGASVINEEGTEIPHPRMADRRFVLVPLAEIAPALQHPVLRVAVLNLLATTTDKSAVHLWQPKKGQSTGGD